MNSKTQDFVTHHAEAVKWSYMTPHGCDLLEQELEEILDNEEPKAGPNAPRDKHLEKIEGRIHEIIERLKTACVIDPTKRINRNSVGFGATITYARDGQESTVTLLGCDEARLNSDYVDWDSELGMDIRYSHYGGKNIKIVKVEYPSSPKKTEDYQKTDFSFKEYRDGIFTFNVSESDKIIILDFLRDVSERIYNRFINIFEDHDTTIHNFIDHLTEQNNVQNSVLTLHEQEFWYLIPYFRMSHDDPELRTVIPKEIVKTIFEALKEAEETIFIQLEKEQVTLKLKSASKEFVEFYASERDIYIMAQFLRYARDADMAYYQALVDVDILTELIRKLEDKQIENGVLNLSYYDEFYNIYSMYRVHKNFAGQRFDGTGYRRNIFLETLKRLDVASDINLVEA